ncbi:MAG TPA: hypothetical protein VFJ53_03930 [Solirubrobacterales bacterium]|nr:hypothetical protein [Solirubrobacterales bacterium]
MARQQYGLIERSQLLELGVGEDEIEYRLSIGRLHHIHQEVYSVGHQVVPREGRWLAAVLATGPGAVLSHWSAAALWMIRPNSRSVIDVTTAHKSRSWDGIKRHHKALPADEVTVESGIPVTSVPRTIFDLAATEDVDTVAAMLRESEHRNLWDRLSLPDLVDRYPGRRVASTTGYSSATSATRSTVTGPAPSRSSSSTAGKATAPAPPSRMTASATDAYEWPATR